MNYSNETRSLKMKALGLMLAAATLIPAAASAYEGARTAANAKGNLSGQVEVVKQVPGGTVAAGAEIGKRHHHAARPAVVIQETRKVAVVQGPRKVMVVEKQRHPRFHREREVAIIHAAPRRGITVIKTKPGRKEVVVVEKRIVENERHHGNRAGSQRIEYFRK